MSWPRLRSATSRPTAHASCCATTLPPAAEQALWIVSTTGGTARRIPGILAHDATWMPDGQRILYSTGDDLYIARDNGTESRKFATLPGRAFWLRWSPDGSRLRFTLLNSETHTSMLWEVSVDGSGAHMLLENWKSAPSAECCGSWTDDGRYYVFQSARDAATATSGRFPNTAGWFGRPAAPVPITNGPLDYRAPIIERGGRRTFFIGLATQSASCFAMTPRPASSCPSPRLSATRGASSSPATTPGSPGFARTTDSLWRSRA